MPIPQHEVDLIHDVRIESSIMNIAQLARPLHCSVVIADKRSNFMKSNMGTTDRFIRTVVGFAIIGVAMHFNSWWGVVALVPLGTAYLGYCGAYRLFGWSTLPKNK
jgi:hypothetical protein